MNGSPRVLVAGIGNVFLGDDGFGVELAKRLGERKLPDGVRVVDFGIRGIDLAFALLDPHDGVLLLDALPRGGEPGTLYVLEPEVEAVEPSDALIEMHNLDPVKVIRAARAMGSLPRRIVVIGCEPTPLDESIDVQVGLSKPVEAALAAAVDLACEWVLKLLSESDGLATAVADASGSDKS